MAKLVKTKKILKTKDFKEILGKGLKFVFPELVFIAQVKAQGEHSRIGFIVSKKVSKKAVERNKVKRRLREIFHELEDVSLPTLSCDMVVIARSYAKKATYQKFHVFPFNLNPYHPFNQA